MIKTFLTILAQGVFEPYYAVLIMFMAGLIFWKKKNGTAAPLMLFTALAGMILIRCLARVGSPRYAYSLIIPTVIICAWICVKLKGVKRWLPVAFAVLMIGLSVGKNMRVDPYTGAMQKIGRLIANDSAGIPLVTVVRVNIAHASTSSYYLQKFRRINLQTLWPVDRKMSRDNVLQKLKTEINIYRGDSPLYFVIQHQASHKTVDRQELFDFNGKWDLMFSTYAARNEKEKYSLYRFVPQRDFSIGYDEKSKNIICEYFDKARLLTPGEKAEWAAHQIVGAAESSISSLPEKWQLSFAFSPRVRLKNTRISMASGENTGIYAETEDMVALVQQLWFRPETASGSCELTVDVPEAVCFDLHLSVAENSIVQGNFPAARIVLGKGDCQKIRLPIVYPSFDRKKMYRLALVFRQGGIKIHSVKLQ